MYVYFDSLMALSGRFNNYPCLIDETSKPLAKVLDFVKLHKHNLISALDC
jgi:hypothetical protein